MHGQHTQESLDGPGMVAIPAHGRITRGNDVFPVPVRACEIGFAERIWPSRPASARSSFSTLRLNIVLTRGIPAAFHEGVHIYTANRYWVSPKFIGSLPRVRWHIISKRVFFLTVVSYQSSSTFLICTRKERALCARCRFREMTRSGRRHNTTR